MSFNEQLPRWDDEGVEPPDSKKTNGWDAGDKPPAPYFNWIFNRIYKVFQELFSKAAEKTDLIALQADVTQRAINVKFLPLLYASAKGDGVTDDKQSFKDAISLLAGKGGIVLAPSGNYNISSNLLITQSDIWVIGSGSNYNHDIGEAGAGGTTLKWTGAEGGTVFKITSISGTSHAATTNCSIQNMAISCNGIVSYGIIQFEKMRIPRFDDI